MQKTYMQMHKFKQHLSELASIDDEKNMWDEAGSIIVEADFGQDKFAVHSPFSKEYKDNVLAVYEDLTGQQYTASESELVVGDLPNASRASPYNFNDSTLLADFFHAFACIFDALAVKAGDKVLEYGPGTGQISLSLARMGCEAYAVDIEARYLQLIKQQADMLQVNVQTELAEFGQGFDGVKFDRVVFFEAFHHCLQHQQVLMDLHDKLTDQGYIVFAGEPIENIDSDKVPFPWCIRLDGLSIYSLVKFGWLELGFQRGYFIELLMRTGWLVEFKPYPAVSSGRGTIYVAKKMPRLIPFSMNFLILTHNDYSGWYEPESWGRWSSGHGRFPLPQNIISDGCKVEITFINFLPYERKVYIQAAGVSKSVTIKKENEKKVMFSVPSDAEYLEIVSEANSFGGDSRKLGIGVKSIEFK